MKKISIIVPVYYNQDNLLPLYVDLKEKVLTKLNMEYELIFVDDGSKDRSVEKIQEILDEAGPRYKTHNPGTWPKQAEMAAEGKWDELKEWQDSLNGGVEEK